MKKFENFNEVSYEEAKEFGKNQRNRKVKASNRAKIKKQMLESFDLIPPITVNTVTMNIIDGQTRWEAFIQLHEAGKIPSDWKLKVMFVNIDEDTEIDAIINANTNGFTWSCDDYFESYVKGEDPSYLKLDEFTKNHELTFDETKKVKKKKFRYAAAIIKGKDCQNELKRGTFTCTDEEVKEAEKIHDEMNEILDITGWTKRAHWLCAMAIQWHEYRKKRPYTEWRKAFKNLKDSINFQKMSHENQFEWNVVFGYVLSTMSSAA
jgi:hypothetical protein